MQKDMIEKRLSMLGVLLAGLCLGFLPLTQGISVGGWDTARHLKWYTAFSKHFWNGEIYPRWLTDINGGLGAPSYFFQAPLPYWITNLFSPLFTNDLHSWHQLGFGAGLALTAAGIFTYLFLRQMVEPKYACLGAIVYMLAPYHLSDFFRKSGLTEFWAMTWIPLILFFLGRMIKGHGKSFYGFTISYACLIMTHLPVTLIVSPLIPLYALWNTPAEQRRSTFLKIGAGVLGGFGLSAIYWVPCILSTPFVRIHLFTEWFPSRYFFNFNEYFGEFEEERKNGLILKNYSILHLNMIMTICIASCLIFLDKTKTWKRESLFWVGVAAYGTFMTTPLSEFLWSNLPLVEKVIYPYRFMVLLDLATAMLVVLAFAAIRRPLILRDKLLVATLSLLVVSWLYPYLHSIETRFYGTSKDIPGLDNSTNHADINEEVKAMIGYPEYWPKSIVDLEVKNYSPTINPVTLHSGLTQVEVQHWWGRKIILDIDASTPSVIDLGHFHYPYWVGEISGQSKPLTITPTPDRGLMRIAIPKGIYQLNVNLVVGPEERLGQMISGISAFVLLASVLLLLRQNASGSRKVLGPLQEA